MLQDGHEHDQKRCSGLQETSGFTKLTGTDFALHGIYKERKKKFIKGSVRFSMQQDGCEHDKMRGLGLGEMSGFTRLTRTDSALCGIRKIKKTMKFIKRHSDLLYPAEWL